jgi:hypothetical protein
MVARGVAESTSIEEDGDARAHYFDKKRVGDVFSGQRLVGEFRARKRR